MICKCFIKKNSKPNKVEQCKIEVDCLKNSDYVAPWYNSAKRDFGELEIVGPKNNPKIVEYLSTISPQFKADEIPWCSAFVNFHILKAGAVGTNQANARSWLSWGRITFNPSLGDVVIFWRESFDSWKGHVGFYAGEKGNSILLLGGNQNNGVSFKYYSKDKLLGFRTMRAA